MLGSYDFCGHYELTFQWLEVQGGRKLLQQYWVEAISEDSQRHARELILRKGFDGMQEYWGHTLAEEAAGYSTTRSKETFRIDMHSCPSKGFLIRNELNQHQDYCDHCMGWIKPILDKAGFEVDHEHNHCGQCWWKIRNIARNNASNAENYIELKNDVRTSACWRQTYPIDTFVSGEKVSKSYPSKGLE